MFYPDRPEELVGMIHDYLMEAPGAGGLPPKAVIAPHAGYIYSGPVAASVYQSLVPIRDRIRRVVLMGPSHRVPFQGIALSGADAFRTPLGSVPVDADAVSALAALPYAAINDDAHRDEHSLEVQIPFLQSVLTDFALVPVLTCMTSPAESAGVLAESWGGEETLIVVSSDLSHYLNYEEARRMDESTSRAIVDMDPDAIGEKQACGRIPIQGLLRAAADKGLTPRMIDLRSSGDTAGPREEVVGYGAYTFS